MSSSEGKEMRKEKGSERMKEGRQETQCCVIFQVCVNCSLVNVAGTEHLISKSSVTVINDFIAVELVSRQ